MEKALTTRQLQVGRELQKVLAEILRSKGMASFGGALLTVSEVRVSPDLSIAKAYISVFPSERAEEVLQVLEENKKEYRGEMGRIIAKQFRIIPELIFYQDTTLDYASRIDELLKK